ncbi:general secretion pathway protein GspB [Photobacterium chitinilyticum]|uniref:Type II secretion system protein GspB C-terminal domain-containing protein n=1 Tax=Photobacterium chitinilyticum TaxID=2485123 RepID=A0A3S3QZC4_9GAMM|nr:general secretion pathway protein GspB [Photobacterium chitinilyticum]RWX54002.1 hypothetical protein EDI28_18885 [Photobacterium chitinilyticum]
MSNLLNAIAQSDQQNQFQPSLMGRPTRQVAAPRRLPSWLLPAVLVMTPVVCTLVYSQYSQTQQHSTSSVASGKVTTVTDTAAVEAIEKVEPVTSISVTTVPVADMPQSAPQVLGEGMSQIRFLSYPELRTEPLPSLNHQFASHAGRTVASPSTARLPAELEGDTRVISSQPTETEWGLDGLDYSELPPLLAEQLKSAIAATDTLPVDIPPEPEKRLEPIIEAVALGELPASVQNRIPPLNFETHIYSSTANSRWVKVNGREAYEGDEIAPGVVLRRIEPRQVVFDFESYLVEMPALSEW